MGHAARSSVGMGSMSMGGLPPLANFPQYYWAVVGTVIGIAMLVNMYNHALYRQRLAASSNVRYELSNSRLFLARESRSQPAKPKAWFPLWIATTYAVMREASNFAVRIPFRGRTLRLPTVGRTTLVLTNVVTLVVLCLYGFDLSDRWMRETVGYRTGFVTIGQLPLIFLLAGKNNIIGYLTGISYERLNWLHRWCARCMLLTATIHMGYFFADWAPFNYIGTQLRTNTLVWKGVAAWSMLVWIVFSSMTPIRGWCYEFFVLQHLVSFAAMVGFIYIHTPAEAHNYIWFAVGIFWLDRVARILRVLYTNISFFHPKQRRKGQMSGLWACKAEFTPLPHNTTRIIIHNPPISWSPGQHVFLSCHSLVPLQSHPFTIASIPKDGKLEFLAKAETGGTKRFFRHAEKAHGLPASNKSCAKTVAIEGPYGTLRPLRQFDTLVLMAGSTGATFTVPLLRDIVEGWGENTTPSRSISLLRKPQGAVTRHVRFVWVIKSRQQLTWFSEQLSSAHSTFTSLQEKLRDIKLELTIYVTCDETFTEEHETFLSTLAAAKPPQGSQHGVVEVRSQVSSLTEKSKLEDPKEEIREIRSNSSNPQGGCCCKTTVDETFPDAIQPSCCCDSSRNRHSTVRPGSQISAAPSRSPLKPLLHPSIMVYSGRPNSKDILRRSLEQAKGESAVVVCGPHSLVVDVKANVCSLSDERAVHKGTGAQGIYIHTESFGY